MLKRTAMMMIWHYYSQLQWNLMCLGLKSSLWSTQSRNKNYESEGVKCIDKGPMKVWSTNSLDWLKNIWIWWRFDEIGQWINEEGTHVLTQFKNKMINLVKSDHKEGWSNLITRYLQIPSLWPLPALLVVRWREISQVGAMPSIFPFFRNVQTNDP